MFNFHKPKIYRSIEGCCICRAKSSSSRFTDSKRYETEFKHCFRTSETREGDICNACVLLVKRWKKLPRGTARHWNHVVDARAGPGTRSSIKVRRGSPCKVPSRQTRSSGSLGYRPDSPTANDLGDGSDQSVSDDSDSDTTRKASAKSRRASQSDTYISSFLDLTYWKRTQICCGIIFTGPHGAVMVDPRLLKPCTGCKRKPGPPAGSLKRAASLDTDSCDSEVTDDAPRDATDVPDPFSQHRRVVPAPDDR